MMKLEVQKDADRFNEVLKKNIQNVKFNPDLSSLIKTVDLTDGSTQAKYEMKYDLCEHIKDDDWQSMGRKEKIDLGEFFSKSTEECPGIEDRLRLGATEAIKEIGKKMGYLNHDEISVANIKSEETAGVTPENKFYINTAVTLALNEFPNVMNKKKVSGIIAHEIAHRIHRHAEKSIAFKLSQEGIFVESLESVSDVLLFPKSPKTEAGKRLSERIENAKLKLINAAGGCINPLSNKIMTDVCSDPSAELVEETKVLEFSKLRRSYEMEADWLTLRVPYFARGLRDHFEQLFDSYSILLKTEKIKSIVKEILEEGLKTHPSVEDRIDYMTRGLCSFYPERNPDLCMEF